MNKPKRKEQLSLLETISNFNKKMKFSLPSILMKVLKLTLLSLASTDNLSQTLDTNNRVILKYII